MRERGRYERLALLSGIGLGIASLRWLSHPWFEATRETYDASIYLLCAKSMLAGDGYSVLGEPFVVRPPGFSLLLAPILAWRGLDFAALNVLVGIFGVAAASFLFLLARPRLGAFGALALAVILFLNPGFRQLSNQVMSDVPGLALALGCLLLARAAEERPSARRDVLLGLAIGLSAWVRTSVVLVLPAVLLARALGVHRPPTLGKFLSARVLGLVAATTLVLAPWAVRNHFRHPAWPAETTLLANYSTGLWHVDGGDPSSPFVTAGEFGARAVRQVPLLLADLGGRLEPEASSAVPVLLGAAMVAALLVRAIRRREAPELFALLSFVVLAFYFAHDWRLALPIFAIGALALAETASDAARRLLGDGRGRALVAAALAAWALFDFAPRKGWDAIRAADEKDVALARAIAPRLAPGDRVAAPVGWHWSVRLDRPVDNLTFAGQRGGFDRLARRIVERGIDAVLLEVDPPEAPRMQAWLEQRYGVGEHVGPVEIVRVHR